MALEDLIGVSKFIDDLDKDNPDGAVDFKQQGDNHIRGVKNVLLNTFSGLNIHWLAFLLPIIYPVGTIFQSTVNTSPQSLFGGVWTAIRTGRVLISENVTYVAGVTGGSKDAVAVNHGHTASSANDTHSHNLTKNMSTSLGGAINTHILGTGFTANLLTTNTVEDTHNHVITVNALTGEDGVDKNMQPYLPVYMWERTA